MEVFKIGIIFSFITLASLQQQVRHINLLPLNTNFKISNEQRRNKFLINK